MTAERHDADLGRGLRWVRGEIDQSLERVRHALALVLDDDGAVDSLGPAVVELRQIGSVCEMARCSGGQLLAVEMADALERIVADAAPSRDAVLGDLVAASYRLAHYVRIVVDGIPDHPLALLNDVNALRVGAGSPALKAPQALARSWKLGHTLVLPQGGGRSQDAVAARAEKVFPILRQAIGLITKDLRHAKAWHAFGQVSAQFQPVVPGVAGNALWSLTRQLATVGARLPEAAHARVNELLKRQAALVVHAGKASSEALESSAAGLLASWALMVVQLDRSGSLANSLLAPLGIEREQLLTQRLQVVEEALKRPAEDSLVAVLRALLQDFAGIKDEVESLHSGGARNDEDIDRVAQQFRNLSATVLGLGDESVAEQIRSLGRDFANLARVESSDAGWDSLAEALLRTEQALNDGLLHGRLRATPTAEVPLSAEARSSILRECLINLTRLKSEVDALLANGRSEHAQNAVAQARELAGALDIFGDGGLTRPFQALQEIMGRADFVEIMRSTQLVAAFADAVASAEYLLEALRDADPDVGIEGGRFAAYVKDLQDLAAAGAVPEVAAEPARTSVPESEIDDDLRDIFIEEAREVLAELQNVTSRAGVSDPQVRVDVRRAFHTLKGSGRMVGATDIGEFGWAIENLLNRCMEGNIDWTSDVETLVLDAINELPTVIDRFQAGQDALPLTTPLIKRADALLGKTDDDAADDVLQTFLQDAQGLLGTLRAADAEAPADDAQTLAWHTLRGGASAIGATEFAAMLAEAENCSAQAALTQKAFPVELRERSLQAAGDALAALGAGQPLNDESLQALTDDLAEAKSAILQEDGGEEDAELRLIFCGEAQELLEDAERLLAELADNPDDQGKAHELQRVYHTLKGSARMANAEGLGDLGTQLDAQAKQALAGVRIAPEALNYFRAGTQAAWALVDAFQSGRDDPAPDVAALAVQEAPAAAVAVERPVVSTKTAAEGDDSQPEPIDSAVPESAPVSAPVAAAPVDLDGVDLELLGIFLPECDELLEEIDSALGRADTAPSAEVLDALFRALHTLKGGARMSGLHTLGEHAHNLETRVEKLRNSRRDIDADERAAIQAEVDRMHAMREAVVVSPDALEEATAAAEAVPEVAEAAARGAGDTARVAVSQLDTLLSEVGEISMFRSRLEQQMVGMAGQLREFDQAIERLRVQVRNLEQATDAQIQARAQGRHHHAEDGDRYEEEFDPLEMDRYTRMQELTRSITETIGDLGSLHRSMKEAVGESEAMVVQQGRLSTTMQDGLLTTLAVPFSRQQQRLARVVRQVAAEEDKQVRLVLEGGETELDRNVLERMIPVVEHVLRNSVVHGIEAPGARQAANKPAEGVVSIRLRRDNNRIVLQVADDGSGLNYPRIREEAVRRGLLAEEAQLDDARLAQFIFEPGFSTASALSLAAGRGVGMDVVASEIRQLGGSIEIDSQAGRGCTFTIRLPFSLAVTQALQVQVGGEDYIVPLTAIGGVARVSVAELTKAMHGDARFNYGGVPYEVRLLSQVLGEAGELPESGYVPVLFVRVGGEGGAGRSFAVVIEHLLGTREVVAKNVGRQVAAVPGIAGASIQPDGRIVVILDVADLIMDWERRALRGEMRETVSHVEAKPLVMVIDDSITMRRVAERMLSRSGYRVALAKDGADGVAQLQTTKPDLVLLDIEMPRMDGFEVASFIRHDAGLSDLPIIMITSRSGEKHRQRAADLGVNGYLIKPYQEQQLLDEIQLQLHEPQTLVVSA